MTDGKLKGLKWKVVKLREWVLKFSQIYIRGFHTKDAILAVKFIYILISISELKRSYDLLIDLCLDKWLT